MIRLYLLCVFALFHFKANTQCNFTLKKTDEEFILNRFVENTNDLFAIDTLHSHYCTVLGNNVYTLYRSSFKISTPSSILLKHYKVINDNLNLIKEYEIEPSIETIQLKVSLNGGFLQLESLKGIQFAGVKPSGILSPFTEDQMKGKKKKEYIFLKTLDEVDLEIIIEKFNDW